MTAAAMVPPPPLMIPGIAADGSVYPIEKMEAHRSHAFHLAVSVFVFRGDDLLIQRRAAGKYHCGGQWANTCCSHPNWGESVACAASRRLREELGFDLPLDPVRIVEYEADVGDGLWEHERVHMFLGRAEGDGPAIAPDPDEVSETRWIAPAALRAEIAATPEAFTPWFRIYVERFPDLKI
jgi:isopentenyl-diphosphate delta-isomerase